MYTPPPDAVVAVVAVTVVMRKVVAAVSLYIMELAKSVLAMVPVTELTKGRKPPVVPPPEVAAAP